LEVHQKLPCRCINVQGLSLLIPYLEGLQGSLPKAALQEVNPVTVPFASLWVESSKNDSHNPKPLRSIYAKNEKG